eukprot:UN18162
MTDTNVIVNDKTDSKTTDGTLNENTNEFDLTFDKQNEYKDFSDDEHVEFENFIQQDNQHDDAVESDLSGTGGIEMNTVGNEIPQNLEPSTKEELKEMVKMLQKQITYMTGRP